MAGTRIAPSQRTTKPGRNNRHLGEVKYGVKVPRSVLEAYTFDKENSNNLWAKAIEKEIGTLIALKCFQFESPQYKPGPDYQYAPLRIIFDVKSDGRRKARLVAGGHVVDHGALNRYASVVKGSSVRLLDVIAHREANGRAFDN